MRVRLDPKSQRSIGCYAVLNGNGSVVIEKPPVLLPGWRREIEEVYQFPDRIVIHYRDYEVVDFGEGKS